MAKEEDAEKIKEEKEGKRRIKEEGERNQNYEDMKKERNEKKEIDLLKKELKEKDLELTRNDDLIKKLINALKKANIDFPEDNIDEKKNDEEKDKVKKNTK